jgi:ketosteroid isomerase-like protein
MWDGDADFDPVVWDLAPLDEACLPSAPPPVRDEPFSGVVFGSGFVPTALCLPGRGEPNVIDLGRAVFDELGAVQPGLVSFAELGSADFAARTDLDSGPLARDYLMMLIGDSGGVEERADEADPDLQLVLAAYAAFAKSDFELAVANLHAEVEWIEPDEFPGGGRYIGPDAVASYLRASRAMWSELNSTPTAHRRGDRIVVIHHVSGRMLDGTWHENTVADVFTVHNGFVTHMQAFADPAQGLSDET